jgi:hypothetical protein
MSSEQGLCSFGSQERSTALRELAGAGVASDGSQRGNVNMHLHSFFSYNAEGWSPTRIAWECAKRGLDAAGLIDFDVLDGLPEFLAAGERLGLRTLVGVETRVYYREFADKEIDSPGEPGVHYFDGIGFCKLPEAGTPAAVGLQRWRDNAQKRNAELVARINRHVGEIAVDYEAQVVPRSPGRCPTERHIISAYIDQAQGQYRGEALTAFWSRTLGRPVEEAAALLGNRPKLEEVVRSRFAKRGGFGYVQPTADSFPAMEEFVAWVRACGAIPMESWLDGTSEGESEAEKLLDCSVAKGCRALNIVPDRNWNIADEKARKIKVANLRRIVTLADARHLPLNIGTEMNRLGLPFADDLRGPVLNEFAASFHRGAMVLVGHTLGGRFADYGYLSSAAEADFKGYPERNQFFAAVGALPPLTLAVADRLRDAGAEKARGIIHAAVRAGRWVL